MFDEIIGTAGLLIVAKRKEIIKNVKDPMNKMQKSGYRLSQKLYDEALRLANEN